MYYDITEAGRRIQTLRKEYGLSQEMLAERLGIGASYLSRVERGQKGCSVDMFVNLSEELNVSLDYLILGKTHVKTECISEEIKKIAGRLIDLSHDL